MSSMSFDTNFLQKKNSISICFENILYMCLRIVEQSQNINYE